MSQRDIAGSDTAVVSITEALKSLMATGLRHAEPSRLPHPILKPFTQIGKGQCGTVWALTGTTQVLKVANEGKDDQSWHDYLNHCRVDDAFRTTFSFFRKDINLPDISTWVAPRNDMFWDEHRNQFPEDFVDHVSGFMSQRIFPVPLPVRSAIVDAFAPADVKTRKETFLSQQENNDCLIRIYLGRRQVRSLTNTFRLRNFDLMVNEMEFLRLDTVKYAEVMARTLAIIHWKAKLDGNDVEFVFGSAPSIKARPTTAEMEACGRIEVDRILSEIDFAHRSIAMWVLDFDQCQKFSENDAGVKQLERAFYFNDPYFPRPISENAKDVALWDTFKETYLTTSSAFTDSEMPKQFIVAVETEGRKRRGGGSLFQ